MSEAAQEIIAAQPVLGDFVFQRRRQPLPLVGFDDRKKEFDKLAASTTTFCTICVGKPELWPRRDPADFAEMALGHALTGVRGTYDRFAYLDQKRQAFEALAALIERITNSPADADVVVAMPRAKAGRRK